MIMQNPDYTAARSKGRRLVRWLRRIVLLGMILVATSVWILLRTSYGHAWISRGLEGAAAHAGWDVRVDGLEGRLPRHIRIAEIRLYQEGRPAIRVERVSFRWSLRALRHRQLWVRDVNVGALHLMERPAFSGREAEVDAGTSDPVLVPDWLTIESLTIEDLYVADTLAPVALHAQIQAKLPAPDKQGLRRTSFRIRMLTDMPHDAMAWRVDVLHNARFTALDADISVHIPDLAMLNDWLPAPAQGRVEAHASLSGSRYAARTQVTVESSAIVYDASRIEELYMRWNAENLLNPRVGALEARAVWNHHAIEAAVTSSAQPYQFVLAFDLSLRDGRPDAAWAATSKGQATLSEFFEPRLLFIEQLDARLGEMEARVIHPVTIRSVDDGFRLEEMQVKSGVGTFTAYGFVSREKMNVEARVEDIPLSTFGFAGARDTKGDLDGRLSLSGHPANPDVLLQLNFEGIQPPVKRWAGPPAQFAARAHLADGMLSSHFQLNGLTGDPVELALQFPMPLSLLPFSFTWPPEGALSGYAKAAADLEQLGALFLLDLHQVQGRLNANFTFSGELFDPHVEGVLGIEQGSYFNIRTGTLLREVDVLLSGGEHGVVIERATATDGGKGRASLTGTLRITPGEPWPFEAGLSLKEFRLVRQDDAVVTGEGVLEWSGHSQASLLRGSLTLSPMELRIPEYLGGSVPELDVIEWRNGARVSEPIAEEVEQRWPHQLAWDVRLAVPDRAHVRGRGLDSEWSGNVRLEGSAESPVITGTLEILRGRFIFFGKRLALTRGLIVFDGAYPPDPHLDVVAESRSGGITARLRLQGPAQDPTISLESSPPMPEDEILARLLFRRDAARITPWQALTLAQAVRTMRGGGSTFDFMGNARRILRVDQFELKESEEQAGATAVRVGRYMGDRTYVELERNVGVEGSRAFVEVEITPTIRLDSEAGTHSAPALGVFWLWDY